MALQTLTARIVCSGTLIGGEIWNNVWHAMGASPTEPTDPIDPLSAGDIAQAFTDFYGDILDRLAATWTFSGIEVSNLGNPSDGPFSTEVVGVVGTNVGDPLPNQDSIVLSLRTGAAGRRGRGRIFLAGFTETDNSSANNRLLSVVRDQIGTAAQDLGTALTNVTNSDGPWSLAVYSRVDDEARQVNQFRVGTIYDTQRRRRNRQLEAYQSYSN